MSNGRYKVIGLAQSNGEADIEIIVKAKNIVEAKAEAAKKEPKLATHKDVRVYRPGGWVRVA